MVKVRCLGLQDDKIANFELVSLGLQLHTFDLCRGTFFLDFYFILVLKLKE